MKGSESQQEKMRWVLFWVFTALFIVLSTATLAATFFEFGGISAQNKDLLVKGVLVEIAVAMFALFYALFGIQRSPSKSDPIRVRLIPPESQNPVSILGSPAKCTLIKEGTNGTRKEVSVEIVDDNGPVIRTPQTDNADYVLISLQISGRELIGSFSIDSRVVELQEV